MMGSRMMGQDDEDDDDDMGEEEDPEDTHKKKRYQLDKRQKEALDRCFLRQPFCPQGRKEKVARRLGIEKPRLVREWLCYRRRQMRIHVRRNRHQALLPYARRHLRRHPALKVMNKRAPRRQNMPAAEPRNLSPTREPEVRDSDSDNTQHPPIVHMYVANTRSYTAPVQNHQQQAAVSASATIRHEARSRSDTQRLEREDVIVHTRKAPGNHMIEQNRRSHPVRRHSLQRRNLSQDTTDDEQVDDNNKQDDRRKQRKSRTVRHIMQHRVDSHLEQNILEDLHEIDMNRHRMAAATDAVLISSDDPNDGADNDRTSRQLRSRSKERTGRSRSLGRSNLRKGRSRQRRIRRSTEPSKSNQTRSSSNQRSESQRRNQRQNRSDVSNVRSRSRSQRRRRGRKRSRSGCSRSRSRGRRKRRRRFLSMEEVATSSSDEEYWEKRCGGRDGSVDREEPHEQLSDVETSSRRDKTRASLESVTTDGGSAHGNLSDGSSAEVQFIGNHTGASTPDSHHESTSHQHYTHNTVNHPPSHPKRRSSNKDGELTFHDDLISMMTQSRLKTRRKLQMRKRSTSTQHSNNNQQHDTESNENNGDGGKDDSFVMSDSHHDEDHDLNDSANDTSDKNKSSNEDSDSDHSIGGVNSAGAGLREVNDTDVVESDSDHDLDHPISTSSPKPRPTTNASFLIDDESNFVPDYEEDPSQTESMRTEHYNNLPTAEPCSQLMSSDEEDFNDEGYNDDQDRYDDDYEEEYNAGAYDYDGQYDDYGYHQDDSSDSDESSHETVVKHGAQSRRKEAPIAVNIYNKNFHDLEEELVSSCYEDYEDTDSEMEDENVDTSCAPKTNTVTSIDVEGKSPNRSDKGQLEGQGQKKGQPEGAGQKKGQPEGAGQKKGQPEGQGQKKGQPEGQCREKGQEDDDRRSSLEKDECSDELPDLPICSLPYKRSRVVENQKNQMLDVSISSRSEIMEELDHYFEENTVSSQDKISQSDLKIVTSSSSSNEDESMKDEDDKGLLDITGKFSTENTTQDMLNSSAYGEDDGNSNSDRLDQSFDDSYRSYDDDGMDMNGTFEGSYQDSVWDDVEDEPESDCVDMGASLDLHDTSASNGYKSYESPCGKSLGKGLLDDDSGFVTEALLAAYRGSNDYYTEDIRYSKGSSSVSYLDEAGEEVAMRTYHLIHVHDTGWLHSIYRNKYTFRKKEAPIASTDISPNMKGSLNQQISPDILHQKRSSTTSLHQRRSSRRILHQQKPSTSSLHQQKPSTSSLHQQKSSTTSLHQHKSSTTSLHQRTSSQLPHLVTVAGSNAGQNTSARKDGDCEEQEGKDHSVNDEKDKGQRTLKQKKQKADGADRTHEKLQNHRKGETVNDKNDTPEPSSSKSGICRSEKTKDSLPISVRISRNSHDDSTKEKNASICIPVSIKIGRNENGERVIKIQSPEEKSKSKRFENNDQGTGKTLKKDSGTPRKSQIQINGNSIIKARSESSGYKESDQDQNERSKSKLGGNKSKTIPQNHERAQPSSFRRTRQAEKDSSRTSRIEQKQGEKAKSKQESNVKSSGYQNRDKEQTSTSRASETKTSESLRRSRFNQKDSRKNKHKSSNSKPSTSGTQKHVKESGTSRKGQTEESGNSSVFQRLGRFVEEIEQYLESSTSRTNQMENENEEESRWTDVFDFLGCYENERLGRKLVEENEQSLEPITTRTNQTEKENEEEQSRWRNIFERLGGYENDQETSQPYENYSNDVSRERDGYNRNKKWKKRNRRRNRGDRQKSREAFYQLDDIYDDRKRDREYDYEWYDDEDTYDNDYHDSGHHCFNDDGHYDNNYHSNGYHEDNYYDNSYLGNSYLRDKYRDNGYRGYGNRRRFHRNARRRNYRQRHRRY